MARDGSGNFSRAVTPPVNGDVANATDFNTEQNDVASALSDSINKAGTKAFAANQSVGGFKFTDLAAGSGNGDSVRYEQLTGLPYQASDATLTALAGLTTAASQYIRATGVDAFTMDSYATVKSNLAIAQADVSGLTTASSPQFTGIELSHATANTLTASGGVLSVEGVAQLSTATGMKQGLATIPVMAAAMLAATTNGATASQLETSSNKNNYKVLGFNTTTQQFACFGVPMPKSFNNGTLTYQALWTFQSSSGGVVWALEAQACSDGDATDGAWGTAVLVTDTALTAGQQHVSPTSAAVTIGGTPATSDMIYFRIKRVPADGGDTLGADAQLIGIRLFFTQNAADDS